jgi:hypothetical protein
MLSDFKAYSTRAFRLSTMGQQRRHYWAVHGSTRYLWNEVNLKTAIQYVLKWARWQDGVLPPMRHEVRSRSPLGLGIFDHKDVTAGSELSGELAYALAVQNLSF